MLKNVMVQVLFKICICMSVEQCAFATNVIVFYWLYEYSQNDAARSRDEKKRDKKFHPGRRNSA